MEWTERRRVAPPDGTLTVSLVAFTTLGLVTAYTMWPQNGASCEERPPPVAPFWVSLSLWTLGVGRAVALVVIAFRHWNPSAFTVPVLVGAVLLPWLVSVLPYESCLA